MNRDMNRGEMKHDMKRHDMSRDTDGTTPAPDPHDGGM